MKTKDELPHIGISDLYQEIAKVKGELQDLKEMGKRRKDYLKLLEGSVRSKTYGAQRKLTQIFKKQKR